ncbi:phytanoyl-CoA dioxygenase family protein [Streptomyces sp. NPDC054835]|uniref:phytanoyl-CoA dioxygenase family protein n=1 Tax=Streptomyces exfoliatus TaxID=1905 RepID=UPI00046535D5|nr:phytanoyl-CoA dioxygenase family protein [Streptomyces exfoliatus]
MSRPIPWSPGELEAFVDTGVLIRRGLVGRLLVDRAAALVDTWMREAYEPDRLTAYTARSFAPEVEQHPDLLALYHRSGLSDLVGQLLQPATAAPVPRAQIQIRLPDGAEQPVKAMHVDGVSCPHLAPSDLRTFTLIAGVVLGGGASADGGALHYVPGGHHRMASYFADDWVLGQVAQTPPDIEAQDGTPFTAEPGDVVVMHHLVPHKVGVNTTSAPRVMAYFRVSHTGHQDVALAALTDPWLEYPALAELALHRSPNA